MDNTNCKGTNDKKITPEPYITVKVMRLEQEEIEIFVAKSCLMIVIEAVKPYAMKIVIE
jgi:precorrin-6x reductase